MQTIPLAAVPSQTLTTMLNGQNCQITLTTRRTGLFMDLSVNNIPVAVGNLCEDRNQMVIKAYLGFIGCFIFSDLQGASDPVYTGLGTRYILSYLSKVYA
jgi:hypothetical protein